MKVYYEYEVDASYFKLGEKTPEGVFFYKKHITKKENSIPFAFYKK